MSRGNSPSNGNKGRNMPWQFSVLTGLQAIKNNTNGASGILNSILSAVKSHQDMEILLVRDAGNSDQVVQQIREYDEESETWSTTFEDISGVSYTPVGPLEYLDASSVLNLILAESIDQGLSLDAINGALTSTARTSTDLRSSAVGTIPAGVYSYSVFNAGVADATVNGAILKPGETTAKDAGGNGNKFTAAISYDGTGTDLAIGYVI